MSSWQWLLDILVSTLPPSPVDTPLSLDTPLERVQSPRQTILLVFLILEWELGWGLLRAAQYRVQQTRTGPHSGGVSGQVSLLLPESAPKACSFLWDTAFLSQPFSAP